MLAYLFSMENLIYQVLVCIRKDKSLSQSHDEIVKNNVTEEDFFLAWQSAQLLNKSINDGNAKNSAKITRPNFRRA